MLGNVLTVDDVFIAVISEVEAMLNSRSLVYVGSCDSPTSLGGNYTKPLFAWSH